MSAKTPAMTAAILAGGRGRRFGGDKLAAILDGQTVLDHTVTAVAGLTGRLLIVGGEVAPRTPVPATWIRDARPGVDAPAGPDPGGRVGPAPGGRVGPDPGGRVGPLGGIVAALEVASTPLVAVVAGDMPLVSVAVLRELSRSWAGEPALVPVHGGQPQPLHAVYATHFRSRVRAAFDAGERSPLSLCRRCGARFVSAEDPPGAGDWYRDIDTSTDLDALTGRLRRH